jgi:hypothetical protein
MTFTRVVYKSIKLPGEKELKIYTYNGNLRDVPRELFCKNVELFSKHGELIWTIQGSPVTNDHFVEAFIRDGAVELVDYDGVAYDLNIDSGDIKMKDWRK